MINNNADTMNLLLQQAQGLPVAARSLDARVRELETDVVRIDDNIGEVRDVLSGAVKSVDVLSSTDLDLIDGDGNVLARYADGHIRSKYFDSRHLVNWVGKKWVVLGDSLTEKNVRTTLNYHDYIQNQTGITVVNKGHSGAGYYARPDDYTFRTVVSSVDLDADVVTIFGSGNDVGKISLGDITDTANTSLCGCINITLDNLYTRLPAVNLGIITPPPWYKATADPAVDWTPENPENDMELYCTAIVEICKMRSIPCLDLYHCSNLRPQNAGARAVEYSKDDGNGVHPDELGHKLIAPRFMVFLRSLLM